MKQWRLVPIFTSMVTSLSLHAQTTQQLPAVVVTAELLDESGFESKTATLGPLGRRDLLDIPYSVSVIPAEMIKNQQASSLNDLIKYLPSTRMEPFGGMDWGRPQSRGMRGDPFANTHLDGLNIMGTTSSAMEMMQRLEVINGMTGSIYGPANPAGNFNFVQKRPTRQHLRALSLGYRSNEAFKVHADIGGPVDRHGKFGYRVNALREQGESFVRSSHLERKLLALAFDIQLTADSMLELNASQYHFEKYGLPGSFAYQVTQSLPAAPDATRQGYGQPFAGLDLETKTFSARIHHAFSPQWTLTASIGRQLTHSWTANPTNRLLGNAGAYTTMMTSNVGGRSSVDSNQAHMNGQFNTGRIQHELIISTIGYATQTNAALTTATYPLGSASLDHPVVYPRPDLLRSGPRYVSADRHVQAYILGDTLTFHPKWSVMLMGSYSELKANSWNRAGVRTARYDKGGISSTLSLTHKPLPGLATYLSYADTLQQGAVANDLTANPGQILSPFRSKQHEIGTKYQLGELNMTAAIFRLERPFAFTGSDNVFRVQGEQINKGIELSLGGKLHDDWSIYGGATFLDAKLGNTASPETTGKRMVGIAKLQASMLVEYRTPKIPGLTLTTSLRHVGRRDINTLNTHHINGYTLMDLGARYSLQMLGRPANWQISINNIANRRYWAAIFPGSIDGVVAAGSGYIGEPRELRTALTVEF